MKKQQAFTLVELMVTMAVFAVLVTIAIPAFNSYVRTNRLSSETNALVGALSFARSEAVKRGANISVCRSSDGATCATDASGWNAGWIIFVNTDNDAPAAVDAGEEILHVYGALSTGNTLSASAGFSNYITYRSNGFGNSQGQFIFCDSTGAASAVNIAVNRIGKTTQSTGGGTCT
jgi:type IV fimbrial biogenesis protein FimT